MRKNALFVFAFVGMQALAQKVAERASTVFFSLLLVCGLYVMVGSASAELSNSEIETLLAYSFEHGVQTIQNPEFETSLSHREDSGKHSHREYMTFTGHHLARNAGSLHDVCVINEDWQFKSANLVEIDQFIICQPTDGTPEDLKMHKAITEDDAGKVLKLLAFDLSGKEADDVQRKVADRFLAEANHRGPGRAHVRLGVFRQSAFTYLTPAEVPEGRLQGGCMR